MTTPFGSLDVCIGGDTRHPWVASWPVAFPARVPSVSSVADVNCGDGLPRRSAMAISEAYRLQGTGSGDYPGQGAHGLQAPPLTDIMWVFSYVGCAGRALMRNGEQRRESTEPSESDQDWSR